MGEYQVKYSEASEFFSQTPCGYLVGFPSLFLIWFIPQSQLVFAVRSVGGKACEEVLTTIHPSRVILFSELFWMGVGNSSPIQQRVFRTLLLFFVRQIYIRESEHLEKVQEQTELQVSAWTQQTLTTTTNLSSAQLSCVLVIHEILFIPQGLVLWLFSSVAHAQVK